MALSVGQKAGYGLTDLGVVVFVVVKQALIMAFLTEALGVPVGIAGSITTAVLIFDMITDPLMGYLSDRTQSRWGRRLPWMVIGAPLMTFAIYMMFSAQVGNLAWVVGFFALASLGFTMIAIPYGAIAGEMTDDPKERSGMTAWRMGFASVGILVGGGVLPALTPGLGEAGAVLAVAPLMIGSVWLSAFIMRNAPRIDEPSRQPWLRQMQDVFSNRAFVALAVIYGVMTLAVAVMTAGIAFVAAHVVTVAEGSALSGAAGALGAFSVMFASFTVGAILSQPIWAFLSNRMGKLPALVLGLLIYAALLWSFYPILPGAEITTVGLVFVAAGMCNGAYQAIPWAMYPDLMDVTRARTGEAVEGGFTAIWLFGQKVGNALGPLVMGWTLAAAGWLEGDGVTQSTEALEQLRWAVTVLPAAILILSVVGLFLFYRPAVRRLMS